MNIIKETNTNAIPKSADESNLYCVSRRRLKLFDWNLKKLDVVFQYDDPQKSFYLKSGRMDQFVKRDNKYILNYQTQSIQLQHQLLIFNESGVLLKENKNINGDFVIDSNNNIIVMMLKMI